VQLPDVCAFSTAISLINFPNQLNHYTPGRFFDACALLKKIVVFQVPSRDMTLTKLWLVASRLGTGKSPTFFYSVLFRCSIVEVCHRFSAKKKASKKNGRQLSSFVGVFPYYRKY
jgi:hypothetical protein